MAATKTLKEAESNLQSYIVTVNNDYDDGPFTLQVWAENVGHAGEQVDDETGIDFSIELIETQAEYEARTGNLYYQTRGANA